MSDPSPAAGDDHEERVEALHGMAAIEESDGSAKGRLVPWNPRTTGPRDVLDDVRAWLYRYRLYLVGAVAVAMAAVYLFGLPSPRPPEWWDVALVAGGVAVAGGYLAGKRVGRLFSNPQYRILDQLDAKTADQLTLRISTERWQDLAVYDHNGVERSTDYLKRKSWNGEPAYECDRYYPTINAAVASWQAGASNKDLREYEARVDEVKTELEEEANKAIETRVQAEEQARRQAQEMINEVLAVYEGVTQPGESDLSERLGEIGDRDVGTSDEVLDDLESQLFATGGADANGHADDGGDRGDGGEEPDALTERLAEKADELVVDLGTGGSDDADEGGAS